MWTLAIIPIPTGSRGSLWPGIRVPLVLVAGALTRDFSRSLWNGGPAPAAV